ncbi:TPA: hypothetical protein PXN49_004110 [Yersinia enterocolitica]|nr:hypothetical protein [Yersinia enterocolitica]
MSTRQTGEFIATIEFDNEKIDSICCKLFYPDSKDNNVEIHLTANEETMIHFYRAEVFRIVGERRDVSGVCVQSRFTAERVHKRSQSTLTNGDIDRVCKITAVPEEIYIEHGHYPILDGDISISFLINKSPILSSNPRLKFKSDGEASKDKTNHVEVDLNNGKAKAIGDVHFEVKSNDGDINLKPYWVLTSNIKSENDATKNINNEYLPDIDNILMLSSFIQRGKVNCKGWMAKNDRKRVLYYRTNIIYASDVECNNAIIETNKVSEFLNKTLPLLKSHKFKDSIILAINALNSSRGTAFEISYISKFIAIESLINSHKREVGFDSIFSQSEWQAIKKNIEKSIKAENIISITKEKRAKFYNKIPEVNRISFGDSYACMMQDYPVGLSDLWPMLKSTNGFGLLDIRNSIAHGDLIPVDFAYDLLVANDCLRILLERVILHLLDWDINDSDISESKLKHTYLNKDNIMTNMSNISIYLNKKLYKAITPI